METHLVIQDFCQYCNKLLRVMHHRKCPLCSFNKLPFTLPTNVGDLLPKGPFGQAIEHYPQVSKVFVSTFRKHSDSSLGSGQRVTEQCILSPVSKVTYSEGAFEIGVLEHGCRSEFQLPPFECYLGVFVPLESCVFFGDSVQRPGYFCEVPDESAVVAAKTHKRPHISHLLCYRARFNHFHFC